MKNYVQPGKTITLAAPYAVAAGDGLLVGAIFGVATATAGNGEAVEAVLVIDLAGESRGRQKMAGSLNHHLLGFAARFQTCGPACFHIDVTGGTDALPATNRLDRQICIAQDFHQGDTTTGGQRVLLAVAINCVDSAHELHTYVRKIDRLIIDAEARRRNPARVATRLKDLLHQ